MPRLVGFEHSNFDEARYRREVCDNHGEALTTDGILEGLSAIAREIETQPDQNWLSAMKDTPFYISSDDR
jgi:hypothetical protein